MEFRILNAMAEVAHGQFVFNTSQHRMSFGVFGIQIMRIRRGNQRQPIMFGGGHQNRQHAFLLRNIIIDQLDVITIFAKDAAHGSDMIIQCRHNRSQFFTWRLQFRHGITAVLGQHFQETAELPAQAARHGNEILTHAAQIFFLDRGNRIILGSLQIRGADDPAEAVIAHLGTRQDHEVKGIHIPHAIEAVFAQLATGRHAFPIEFRAQNGFDPVFLALAIKFNRSKHIAMISESDRLMPKLFGFFNQFIDADGTIEQRVFAVDMKMYVLIRRAGVQWAFLGM